MCQCQDRKGQKILVIGRFSRIVYALKNLDCDNEKKRQEKKLEKEKMLHIILWLTWLFL